MEIVRKIVNIPYILDSLLLLFTLLYTISLCIFSPRELYSFHYSIGELLDAKVNNTFALPLIAFLLFTVPISMKAFNSFEQKNLFEFIPLCIAASSMLLKTIFQQSWSFVFYSILAGVFYLAMSFYLLFKKTGMLYFRVIMVTIVLASFLNYIIHATLTHLTECYLFATCKPIPTLSFGLCDNFCFIFLLACFWIVETKVFAIKKPNNGETLD